MKDDDNFNWMLEIYSAEYFSQRIWDLPKDPCGSGFTKNSPYHTLTSTNET